VSLCQPPNSTGRSRRGEGITAEDMTTPRWVTPTIVVQVAFVEWTRDGLLRHPRFVGVRDDKRRVRCDARVGDGVGTQLTTLNWILRRHS